MNNYDNEIKKLVEQVKLDIVNGLPKKNISQKIKSKVEDIADNMGEKNDN